MMSVKRVKQPFRIDPEIRGLLGGLDESEFSILEKTILRDGKVRDPLVVWINPRGTRTLIDGHNRWKIIKNNPHLSYKIVEVKLPTKQDAKAYMIENQIGKRNLSALQRVILVLPFEDYYRDKAKNNQKLGKGRGKKGLSNAGKPFEPVDTVAELAKLAHCSRSMVGMVKTIIKYGGKRLNDQIVHHQNYNYGFSLFLLHIYHQLVCV